MIHNCFPHLTKTKIKAIIDSNDFQNEENNELISIFLDSIRKPQIEGLGDVTWFETELNENDFRNLRVITGRGWDIFSLFSGRISVIATLIHKKPKNNIIFLFHKFLVNIFFRLLTVHPTVRKWKKIIDDIVEIERKGIFEMNLILLHDNVSGLKTILEGNKNAIAFYISRFLKREEPYSKIRVFVGHKNEKSEYQR